MNSSPWPGADGSDEEVGYWRAALASIVPLDLPTDRPRLPDDVRGLHNRKAMWSAVDFTLAAGLTARLTELGGCQQGGPFSALFSVFTVLLARYSQQTGIAVGVLVTGAQHEDISRTSASPLILHVDLSGVTSFTDVLCRTREAVRGAVTHQGPGFERVMRERYPGSGSARNPLLRVQFAVHDIDAPAGSTELRAVRSGSELLRIAMSDLALEFRLRPGGSLAGELGYCASLFDQSTIERMAGHFVQLAERVAAAPQARLDWCDLLTGGERDQILKVWNQTDRVRPQVCVHELIAEQAAATPGAAAVVGRSVRLTYGQLDQRANHLAHHLAMLGVGPDSLVGVCLHRDTGLIVTLLAVLKAGGAYVPLDPAHPAARLRYLIKDTAAPVVIVDQATRGLLAGSGARLVVLDQAGPGYAAEPPCVEISPENLLYVLYTSGTTGQPKGVLVTHRGMVNRILWAKSHHGLGPSDRVLQKTPITFDAAGWELFAPLAVGGMVIMAEDGAERDPAAIIRAVIRYSATILQVVPSMLRLLAEEPDFGACTSLRAVFSGGEPLTEGLCARVRDSLDADLYNLYGLTEATIDSTCWLYRPGEPISIGALLDNVHAYVVDVNGNLTPAGIPGELCIGGAGLARGYLGRPALTAARFVPCPFTGQAGARMYRTGDRARWMKNGELQFLGRMDDQVKITGVRIEPGEIEAVLSGHPGVTGVAVIARTDPHGDHYLIAYVQPADADVGALQALAVARLPRAMIPSAFVPLAQMPRTSSGKVDRRALPSPESAARLSEQESIPPRTPTEHRVARVFGEVLGHDQVGVHDDFFRLGGRSLLAIRAAARLRAMLNADISPRVFFAGPTVAQLARFADAAGADRSAAITPTSRGEPLTASSGQRRLWFLDQLRPGLTEYVVTVALRLRGPLDVQALMSALGELVARHEVLRTRCVLLGDDLVQLIDPPDSVPLALLDLGDRRPADFVAEVSKQPFRLADEAPFRAYLARIDDADNALVLSLHHIACDGWSMDVIARELRELYAACSTGQPAAVVPLPVQFADFAGWQRNWLDGEDAAAQLAYWRDRLDGLEPLELPTDRKRAAQRDTVGAVVEFQVPAALAQAVTGIGRIEGATPFMTMLTVFEILLARRTGRSDIAVGTTVAARSRPELEDLIGFFMNSVVLRSILPDGRTFAELLRRVRDSALGAFAHQDLPFDWLVDELRSARDPARNPLFQVLFEMEDTARLPFTLPGVAAEPLPVGWLAAKLDVTLQLAGQDDGGYSGELQYAVALFDQKTAEGLVADYLQLLEQIAAQPEAPLDLIGPVSRDVAAQEPGQPAGDEAWDFGLAVGVNVGEARPVSFLTASAEFVELTTAAERTIAGMWSDVLEVDRVGAGDNFFELGGQSMLAAQVRMRIRDELDIDLPLHVLFDAPVLADLAKEVERVIRADVAQRSDAELDAVHLEDGP